MSDFSFLLRTTTIFLIVFGLPFGFAMRAMARQIRDDYRMQRKQRTKAYEALALKMFVVGAGITVVFIAKHDWLAAFTIGGLALSISATIWLNQPKNDAA